MDTHILSFYLLSYKLKTARQKKRLLKEDKEKQLIRLDKRHQLLRERKRKLPMVPMEKPYQKGWKRIFVLREDVAASEKSDFYQKLLDKINTVQYYHDRSFMVKAKRRKNGKRVYVEREQLLKWFYPFEWMSSRNELTPEEKLHFHVEESRDSRLGVTHKYVFNEPWRYRLQVLPNIIYEVPALDCELEQELSEIRSKIDSNNLWPLIEKLTNGRKSSNRAWRCWEEKAKYKSPFRNNAFQTKMDEYVNNKKTTNEQYKS